MMSQVSGREKREKTKYGRKCTRMDANNTLPSFHSAFACVHSRPNNSVTQL